MSIENKRIQFRRGTSTALAEVNEVPLAGELIFETDTGKYKLGDGESTWTELSYVIDSEALDAKYVSSSSLGHETWTMTLEDDSVITKDVATWTSQG